MRHVVKNALFGAACVFGAAMPALAQDAPIARIDWQVEDRFRFFSEPATFEPHLLAVQAFAGLDGQRDEFGRKKINGEWQGPVQFAERHLARTALEAGHDGWAAHAWTVSDGTFTCWSPGARRVRQSCLEEKGEAGSRLFPHQVRIAARLGGAGAALFAGKQCAWFVHTGTVQDWQLVTEADCAGAAALTAPVKTQFSLLAQVLDPASPNGVLTQATAIYQQVDARVIVGLGDSYASGEGNPDYPANYSRRRTLGGTFRPQPTSEPRWLDPACHRSVYSHQQRVAMQLAAESPRAVITYLGYACSGATIPAIIDATSTDADHVEPVTAVTLRDAGVRKGADVVLAQANWSQLDHAVRDLCADKGAATAKQPIKACSQWRAKPDLVLLSAGGNDIGFSNVVKWAVAGTAVAKVRFLSGAEKPETIMARAQGKTDLANCSNDEAGYQCRLSNRFASLAVAIENRLGLLDRGQVVTGPYPDPMSSETGRICLAEAVNAGADSEHFVSTTNERLQRLQAALFEGKSLTNAMKEAVSRTGWTWTDALSWAGAFQGRGVCAVGEAQADALNTIQLINGEWQPVSPAAMKAYASRQRWFRTFNDSILMQYHVTRIEQLSRNPRQPVDYHYQAGISGYFHPTAEGQAVMADMLLNAARCRLWGGC